MKEDSDVCRINAAAGVQPVQVSRGHRRPCWHRPRRWRKPQTAPLPLTVAPITLAWGVHSDSPRVVPRRGCAALAALVTTAPCSGQARLLQKAGQGWTLAAGARARRWTPWRGVRAGRCGKRPFVSLGGNVYARGTKPDGTPWRVGFRDPSGGDNVSLASFELTDAVIAVSGDYERYFEQDGVRYGHIMNPATGAPAQSDIISVGVVCETGLEADVRSTEMFVRGRDAALAYFEAGGTGLMLCEDGVLYVSAQPAGQL